MTSRARARALLVLATCFAMVVAVPDPVAGDGQQVIYRPPVIAPVTDHFRAPDSPYGPGNRGIDYATAPGSPVHAAAPGTVTFAGNVAGRLVVVLLHTDGLRTTYDDLATAEVSAGDDVVAGGLVGTATAHLHFGVRDGTTYLDPELLFAAAGHAADVGVVARLVPTGGAPARGTGAPPGGARRAGL